MALLRSKDISKMNQEERNKRIAELKLELTKSAVTANKSNAKTREIKRAIARILTINTSKEKEALTTK